MREFASPCGAAVLRLPRAWLPPAPWPRSWPFRAIAGRGVRRGTGGRGHLRGPGAPPPPAANVQACGGCPGRSRHPPGVLIAAGRRRCRARAGSVYGASRPALRLGSAAVESWMDGARENWETAVARLRQRTFPHEFGALWLEGRRVRLGTTYARHRRFSCDFRRVFTFMSRPWIHAGAGRLASAMINWLK